MPVIMIHENVGRTPEQRQAVVEGITNGFVSAYGVPSASIRVFFQTYTKEEFGMDGKLNTFRTVIPPEISGVQK